jgi:lipoyl(octanoyl) transferase
MNHILNQATEFRDLGLIDYKTAWDYQTDLFNQTLSVKSENRTLQPGLQKQTPNYLLFCEHPHVFTLGKSGDEENLLVKKSDLPSIGATYFHTNRGGDITYHGPGQIVGYPILDLENFFTDIHRYLRMLEESVIQTLLIFGIPAGRIPGLTGVWVDSGELAKARKICAFGVRTSRWVTMHGLALNVNSDLRYFSYIVPCGLENKSVTSMEQELGARQNMEAVKKTLKEKMSEQFAMELI